MLLPVTSTMLLCSKMTFCDLVFASLDYCVGRALVKYKFLTTSCVDKYELKYLLEFNLHNVCTCIQTHNH